MGEEARGQAPGRRPRLLTFGHGRLGREELGELVGGAGIELVVDIRRFPGSRANSAAARGQLPELLAERGVGYRWDERLGGRRRLTVEERAAAPDTWWRVEAFRAYAAWTRSPEFRAGIEDLLRDAQRQRTAVMCSESVWWRCHRRVVADVVLAEHGVPVLHLMHDARLLEHEASEGARRDAQGHLVWDGGAGPVS